MILIAFPFRWAWTWLKTQKRAWHVTHGHNLESHRFRSLAVVCGKCQNPALLPALTEQHDIWLNQAPVMGCHTNIACLVLSFPGSEQSSHIASGCSHHVPLVAAEPVLKKQMYSWSRSFGNRGRNKGSMACLEEYQMRSPRTQLHGLDNGGTAPPQLTCHSHTWFLPLTPKDREGGSSNSFYTITAWPHPIALATGYDNIVPEAKRTSCLSRSFFFFLN